MRTTTGRCVVRTDLDHAKDVRVNGGQIKPAPRRRFIEYGLNLEVLQHHIHGPAFQLLGAGPVDLGLKINSASLQTDVDPGGCQVELSLGHAGQDVLGRMLARRVHTVCPVHTGPVRAAVQGSVKRENDPAVHNVHLQHCSITHSAPVSRLPPFLRMKQDRVYRYLAIVQSRDIDVKLKQGRFCPVQSLHGGIITEVRQTSHSQNAVYSIKNAFS